MITKVTSLKDGGRLAILLLFCIGTLTTAGAQDGPHPRYRELRIPGKDHFPVSEAKLLEMRDGQRVAAMRTHAWKVFAGLTHAEGPRARRSPIWDSWYTKCDVRLAKCLPASAPQSNQERLMRGFSIPAQDFGGSALMEELRGRLKNSKELSQDSVLQVEREAILSYFAADPQLASVLYNQPARDHILRNHFYSSDYLDTVLNARLQSNAPENEREIAAFPANSVALKTAWQLVSPDERTGLAQIHVWDPAKERDEKVVETGLSNGAKDWGKNVMVDTTKPHECSDRDYADEEPIPIGCFYFFKITKEISPYWWNFVNEVNNGVVPGSTQRYLVLMAVHVTTKEIGDWVWATFWWYNRVSYPVYGCT
jgi:hypothetical protein